MGAHAERALLRDKRPCMLKPQWEGKGIHLSWERLLVIVTLPSGWNLEYSVEGCEAEPLNYRQPQL